MRKYLSWSELEDRINGATTEEELRRYLQMTTELVDTSEGKGAPDARSPNPRAILGLLIECAGDTNDATSSKATRRTACIAMIRLMEIESRLREHIWSCAGPCHSPENEHLSIYPATLTAARFLSNHPTLVEDLPHKERAVVAEHINLMFKYIRDEVDRCAFWRPTEEAQQVDRREHLQRCREGLISLAGLEIVCGQNKQVLKHRMICMVPQLMQLLGYTQPLSWTGWTLSPARIPLDWCDPNQGEYENLYKQLFYGNPLYALRFDLDQVIAKAISHDTYYRKPTKWIVTLMHLASATSYMIGHRPCLTDYQGD